MSEPIFVLQIPIFRSVGNVIQQIKKEWPKIVEMQNKVSVVTKDFKSISYMAESPIMVSD